MTIRLACICRSLAVTRSFLKGQAPDLTFEDGLEVTKLLMACYMSAELGKRLSWPVEGLDTYRPAAVRNEYTATV